MVTLKGIEYLFNVSFLVSNLLRLQAETHGEHGKASPLAQDTRTLRRLYEAKRSSTIMLAVLLFSASALLRYEKTANADLAAERRCTEEDHQQRKATLLPSCPSARVFWTGYLAGLLKSRESKELLLLPLPPLSLA